MKNNGTSGYIADMRKFQGASPENMRWILEEWFPMMYNEGGLRTLGMVIPPDIFAQFSMDAVISEGIAGLLNKEKFIHYNEAKEWIMNYTK